jgi:hypothetical protein
MATPTYLVSPTTRSHQPAWSMSKKLTLVRAARRSSAQLFRAKAMGVKLLGAAHGELARLLT